VVLATDAHGRNAQFDTGSDPQNFVLSAFICGSISFAILHRNACYNAAMIRRVCAIAIKVFHRLWSILTSDALTKREYTGIMIILSALALTIWQFVEGNTTLFFSALFAFPFLVAAAGVLYPSFVNRRHARRVLTNRCVVCGYDLCASPQRCSECGFVPTRKVKNPT